MESHILHLADRIAVLTGAPDGILGRRDSVVERIREQSGKMFVPDLVKVFCGLASKYNFWLEASGQSSPRIFEDLVGSETVFVGSSGFHELARLFCRLIDFRSSWTATHSTGVAVSAQALAELLGFSKEKAEMVKIAGLVHDLGKLAVPLEILEKQGKFTEDDFEVMKKHPCHTYSVLRNIPDLDEITTWASCHHERLNGAGYPFGFKARDLSMEARLLAVADVFTALFEDRPYRKAMSPTSALRILEAMAADKLLDGDIIATLVRDSAEIDGRRARAQSETAEQYHLLWEGRSCNPMNFPEALA